MDPSYKNFVDHYASLTDEELLLVYVSSDLVETAQIAIEAEIKRRELGIDEIVKAAKTNDYLKQEREETKRQLFTSSLAHYLWMSGVSIIVTAIAFAFGAK